MKDTNCHHPIPEWLTLDYFEEVLRKYKKDDELKIMNLDIKPATSKGENYASVMTRVKIDYVENSKSKAIKQDFYIVKTMHESEPLISEIMNSYEVGRTEMLMYEKILPKLSELLKEIGDQKKIFADTVHVDYENSAIIFEDLAVLKFTIADRLSGFDKTYTKLALKQLAKMHAAAAVLNERTPGVLTKFDHGIFNRHTKAFASLFEGTFECCASYAGECPELGEYYKEKMLKLKPHIMEYNTRVYDPRPEYFNTLNHGDFWTNNIMINYTNDTRQTVKDVVIIDFQFCSWSTPAVDLHYFFNTSLQEELRRQHQDELLHYYYRVLSKTLRKLNFKAKMPTLRDICIQFEAARFHAVLSAFTSQALMINDKTDDADINALFLNDERSRNFMKLLYSNKTMRDNVKFLLPLFDRKGLLDLEQ